MYSTEQKMRLISLGCRTECHKQPEKSIWFVLKHGNNLTIEPSGLSGRNWVFHIIYLLSVDLFTPKFQTLQHLEPSKAFDHAIGLS